MSLRGDVRGPLRSPEASYRVSGHDLEWSVLEGATLDASGRVSSSGLAVEAFAFTSQAATVGGRGTLALGDGQQSAFTGRWTNVGADLVAKLFSRPFDAESRTALAGSAQLSWHGTRPRVGTVAGRVEATARGAGHESVGDRHHRGRRPRRSMADRRSAGPRRRHHRGAARDGDHRRGACRRLASEGGPGGSGPGDRDRPGAVAAAGGARSRGGGKRRRPAYHLRRHYCRDSWRPPRHRRPCRG